MKNFFKRLFHAVSYSNSKGKLFLKGFLFTWIILSGLSVFAQNTQTVRGKVVDEGNDPLPGVSIVLKNTTSNGTVTDMDGNFTLTIPSGNQTLVFSFLGMKTQEVAVTGAGAINVVMKENTQMLEEVVVVGYGTQKKESVVGAITQTSGKILERAGGVPDLGMALTGNLPGVVTMSSTGRPGDEDPHIVIRGVSSWNNSDPLVLVDGIERPMNTVDVNSVETISVLKDASATAVFGVRGANGVILITTKRGQEGKANINFNYSTAVKTPSKLPKKYDSYDALMYLNQSIERELAVSPSSWSQVMPYELIDKYRNPANQAEIDRFPNVDWQKETLNDYALSHNANMSISGGTKFVKYFANFDYQHEGDLYRKWDNHRGYQAGFGYDRMNVRSNLDFALTPTSTFKVGLSGSHGVKKEPEDRRYEQTIWRSIYWTAPDAMQVRYSDGLWGFHHPNSASQTQQNSVESLAISGVEYLSTDRINTDFTLNQDLGKFVKGLNARLLLAFDNEYVESRRGVDDRYRSDSPREYIYPKTGQVQYSFTVDANSLFDWQESVGWDAMSGSVDKSQFYRRLYYSFQLNYANTFAKKHNVTAMGDFNREEYARGSAEPSFRENWVFRATYDYDRKYLLEYNGSYNGSEKFAPQNRFVFFQSGALGWLVTEEQFIKNLNLKALDMLKLRVSYGRIGDDMIVFGSRWPYMSTWDMRPNSGDYDARFQQTLYGGRGPYNVYYESGIGNNDIHWEISTKTNFGIDYSFFRNFISGNFELFKDKRRDIFISGSDRAVPSYFGAAPPSVNLGAVDVKGLEFEIRLNKQVNKNLRLWSNFAYSHAKSKVLERDDAELLPAYMKKAGFTIDQTQTHVDVGYINNWDELYGSASYDAQDGLRTPGQYAILDFNGDGIIDKDDQIPYSFSPTPENTFNLNLGADYKGWSFFVQFYGVTNVDRYVPYVSFEDVTRHTIFEYEGTYWSKDNQNADVPMPRMWAIQPSYSRGTRYLFDASYLRLKNVELGYTFTDNSKWVRSLGMKSLRFYMNGNNLWLYTKMPDDREANFGTNTGSGGANTSANTSGDGAYPTLRRINFGFRISL